MCTRVCETLEGIFHSGDGNSTMGFVRQDLQGLVLSHDSIGIRLVCLEPCVNIRV